jgi:hypothetical protein
MNKPFIYTERKNRRREHETYGKWVYDWTFHLEYQKTRRDGRVTRCGLKPSAYALNYGSLDEVNCPICRKKAKLPKL